MNLIQKIGPTLVGKHARPMSNLKSIGEPLDWAFLPKIDILNQWFPHGGRAHLGFSELAKKLKSTRNCMNSKVDVRMAISDIVQSFEETIGEKQIQEVIRFKFYIFDVKIMIEILVSQF